MNWTHWIAVPMDDQALMEFTPIEPNEDGSVNIVFGMCLLTSLDDVIDRGALYVAEVTNTFEPEFVRILYKADAQ